MKGNTEVLAHLNKVLANELVAINQYFLHARMFKNFGFSKLNSADYKRSIKTMKNADDLIERILFLEGLPNLQDLGRLFIGEDCQEMINANMKFELAALDELKKAVAVCEQHKDFISRKLLTDIQHNAEEQIDWLESQQHLIEETGLQNYLQSQCD